MVEEEVIKKKQYLMLKRVEIPFSEEILISKSRRVVPYIKGKSRVPKKYLNENYIWNKKNQLIDAKTGVVIIANSKTAGKPRYKRVNGQDIYNGNTFRQGRALLAKSIHERFTPYLREIEPLLDVKIYPLGLHINFYVWDRAKNNIDNDNKWIWEKCIQDTLTQLGIIPDDNPYIVWENVKRTILISPEKEEKIVIEIYGYA